MIARPAYTDAQRGPPSDHGGIRKRPWRQPALAPVSVRAGQGQEALSTRYIATNTIFLLIALYLFFRCA